MFRTAASFSPAIIPFILRLHPPIPPLIHIPCHLLPDLIAADHDRTRRCNLQAPCGPPAEQTWQALCPEDMVQEPRHRAVLWSCDHGITLPCRSGDIVRVLEHLLPCLADVEGSGDDCGNRAAESPRCEGVDESNGMILLTTGLAS